MEGAAATFSDVRGGITSPMRSVVRRPSMQPHVGRCTFAYAAS